MTVSTSTSRIAYTGNGVTTSFSVPFPFIQDDYLIVIRTVIATGVETVLTLDSVGDDGYSVTGAGGPSGSVIVVTAPTALERLSIIRSVDATQEADFVANDPLPSEVIEDSLDKLTMLFGDLSSANGLSRVPILYPGDIDGSGRYNSNGNRYANAADGVSATDLATVQQITSAGSGSFVQAGTGAVIRTMQDKARDIVSVKDFGAVGDGVTDDTAAIQNAVNFGIAFMPPGVYCVSEEIVIPDGCGLIGKSAFWKRRTGYVYDGSKQSVIKYVGAGGSSTCVVRASSTAVGVVGSDFVGPETDDLTNIILRDFHVDANGLADYGIYVYRAGNQATIGNLTAQNAVEANHVHLGCFAAAFGTFGSYEAENEGVVCGWDIFAWGSAEATNFAYTARFLTANNGTAGTYSPGTATDLEGSGGRFSVGRGSVVYITSESNNGRACVLSQLNIASGAGGPTDYVLEYLEGNADGPYVDYRDGMDALRLRNGFLHPGNGSTLLPQNITIEGKNNSGVVTPDSGPADRAQWLVIEGIQGDLSGVGVAIDSNTYKMIVRDCGRNFTFPDKFPQTDDYIPSENQVGAGVYFTASASPTVWKATNGALVRNSAGTYTFTFTRPFRTGTLPIPTVSLVITAALDTRVRITSLSETAVVIRTYDNAGVLADTGDRVSCLLSGILAYQ